MRSALTRLLEREVTGFESLLSLDRLPQGASAETYEVRVATTGGEERFCLRRAPGGAETRGRRPTLRDQAALMDLASRGGVPAPEVVHVLEPGDGIGEGFLMRWVEGESLGARIVRSEELAAARNNLATSCGEILARIHALDLDADADAGDLGGRLHESQAQEEVELTWARYRDLGTPWPMIDYTARWLLEHLPSPVESRLVHAEFRNGNFIVGTDGIRAVLDWENARLGDPLQDLGWLCNNSWTYGRPELPVGGFGTHEQLFAGYESVSGGTVDREAVFFWTVYGSFWWAVTCLGMVQLYRTGPDPSIERAAIGRRSSEAQIDCVNLLLPGPARVPQAGTKASSLDMPGVDELLAEATSFLREDVMDATAGRVNFLSRVTANVLDIVRRESSLGERVRREERDRLETLLERQGSLEDLRWELTTRLREHRTELDHPGLGDHLRQTVVDQISIDQPRYSGLRTTLARQSEPLTPSVPVPSVPGPSVPEERGPS